MGDRFEDEAAGTRTEAADRRYDDRHREGNMSHAMRPQRQVKTQSARLLSVTELGGLLSFAGARANGEVAPIPDLPSAHPGTEGFDPGRVKTAVREVLSGRGVSAVPIAEVGMF